jgi:hypothetical protein
LVARDGELLGIISARDLTRWLDRAGLLGGDRPERETPGGGTPGPQGSS